MTCIRLSFDRMLCTSERLHFNPHFGDAQFQSPLYLAFQSPLMATGLPLPRVRGPALRKPNVITGEAWMTLPLHYQHVLMRLQPGSQVSTLETHCLLRTSVLCQN